MSNGENKLHLFSEVQWHKNGDKKGENKETSLKTIRATKRLTNGIKKNTLVNLNVHDKPLKGGTKEFMIYNNWDAMWSSFAKQLLKRNENICYGWISNSELTQYILYIKIG